MRRSLGALVLALLLFAAIGAPSASAEAVGVTDIQCDHITWTYTGFPNAENNQVTQIIAINGVRISEEVVTFNGPEFTNTTPINAPAKRDKIDAHAFWNTNGARGSFDHSKSRLCEKPAYTIHKEQMVVGQGGPFTSEELLALIGETVDYRIVVTNTGNVPLTFNSFNDPHCDAGTIEGGPGAAEVLPGESTVWTCSHVMKFKGEYVNFATVTGDPPLGQGKPKTMNSNRVVVRGLERPAWGTCHNVTFFYRGFPNLPNNEVTQRIQVDGVTIYEGTFTFNGPNAMDTIEIGPLSPGKHKVDAFAHWNTNGFHGSYDVATPVTCT